MLVYRICKSIYANDFSGNGARVNGGRWNSVGLPVVYTSATPSLSFLEILCSTPLVLLNNDFKLITIEINDSVEVEVIKREKLQPNWKLYQDYGVCRTLGDRWIKSLSSPLLCVPSAVMPFENNFLINPLHKKSGLLKVKSISPVEFDERIIRNVLAQ